MSLSKKYRFSIFSAGSSFRTEQWIAVKPFVGSIRSQ